jgi:MoxR-like ATPase
MDGTDVGAERAMSSWPIYRGVGEPHDGIAALPDPPSWRSFDGGPTVAYTETGDPTSSRRLGTDNGRKPPDLEVQMVNAALYLRRPLLVTGTPGVGKSTLAYSVATELKLGTVLRWPITSRSTLREGLYSYDPIGRLRDENIRRLRGEEQPAGYDEIGRHIRLGPLGTALLPYAKPRVLLVDEIDKSDIDLPNDLLNVLEEGEYEIDELTRLSDDVENVEVKTADLTKVPIHRGKVRTSAFPFVVLTSNGEREFPPAFLRRCLRLKVDPPDSAQLVAILAAHLGTGAAEAATDRISSFVKAVETGTALTTDQLLNAIYLATSGGSDPSMAEAINKVMEPLNR